MFSSHKQPPPRSNIIIPLYVYPFPGAWDPLFTAINTNPHITFTIIINPSSGPGTSPTPDANYLREIPRLNALANVRTVGYVSSSWTKRDVMVVLSDVKVYAGWSRNTNSSVGGGGLGLKGIFLDETPAVYSEGSKRFLEMVYSRIKLEGSFGEDPLVIQNPGTIPDARYLPFCDISVVFEGAYATFQQYGFLKTIAAFQKASNCHREDVACIMHAFPSDDTSIDQRSLVRELRKLAGEIFVTGLSVNYYAGFWAEWPDFVKEIAN